MPCIFGAFCLKTKWGGGSMSELSSEAPDLNNIVGFWCLGSHQRRQSPQSKSAPLKVELGAWGLQIWHGTYGRPQHFWTDTCVWRNKSSPDCLACCAAPCVDFISTENNRHHRQMEIVRGNYQTSSATPEAAQRLRPKLGQSCRLADPGYDLWWDQRMPLLRRTVPVNCVWFTWQAGFLLVQYRAWGIYTSLLSLLLTTELWSCEQLRTHQSPAQGFQRSHLQILPVECLPTGLWSACTKPEMLSFFLVRPSCVLYVLWSSVKDV